MNNMLFQIAAIALASMGAQWLGWRLKLPAIVFLLLAGFLLGPALGVIKPEILMGNLLHPAVTAAVAIILFEGSLNLKFREIKEVRRAVRDIVLVGAPLGWAAIAGADHYVAGLSWPVSITFGGMMVVTGPTVIIPLLRNARLVPRVGAILKWEGIINDPLGVTFAVLSYEFFSVYGHTGAAAGPEFYLKYAAILLGVGAGSFAIGRASAFLLERGFIPEYLKAPFLVTAVLSLYAACDTLLSESGLIAVSVFGMTLANVRVASLDEIRRFKETITLLLVSGVFILLTANLDPAVLLTINLRGALFIALLVFVIRPVTVGLSLLGTGMKWREIALIGWIAPRGIVCAALAGVMQPLLIAAGYPGGANILPLAFAIVIVTVVLHSFTVKPLARRLKLATIGDGGLIIVGASEWTVQLAEQLIKAKVPVLIADTHFPRLKGARLANIPVYYGELLSEEAEYNMELNRYGALLAATENSSYNALVCNAYAPILGREHVYQISSGEEHTVDRKRVAVALKGRVFVRDDSDYLHWWRSFFGGYRFRLTTINQHENAGKLTLKDGETLAGTISKSGVLTCRTTEFEPPVREGDMVLLYAAKAEGAAA